MQNNLFRKSSIENISSPERLNEYIKVTHPGIWGVLIGSLALVVAVCLWGFIGSIPDTISTEGVIFPQSGVTNIIPKAGGRITDIRVSVGDYVEAGQIIAVIPQSSILQKIQEVKNNSSVNDKNILDTYNEYEMYSLVVSPVSGIVLYARNTNETISSTQPIAKIIKQEKYSDNKQVISYVKCATAKRLKEGMEVQVSPDFAPREEYGYMYGHITSIGTYPVTQDDVERSLGNVRYTNSMLLNENCVEVRITLTVDPESKNKIKWSNNKGEHLPLTIGTQTNILIIIKDYKPYELVFN